MLSAASSTIHTDVGVAIVNLVERKIPSRVQPIAPAEITSYGKHAVIAGHAGQERCAG